MNQLNKYDVFLMPGMAANSKIFEFISLPVNYQIHLLDWEMPLVGESIQDYALRFSKKIKGENIILVGVSFGGILVQEISKIITIKNTIIISSIKSRNELPFFMQINKSIKAYKFFNSKWISDFESLALFALGPIVKNRIELYRKYLSVRDENYLKWSIHQMLNWEQKNPLENIIHIHGTHDLVFPSIYIKNAIFVSGGNHAMILRKASWFNKNLPRIISEN